MHDARFSIHASLVSRLNAPHPVRTLFARMSAEKPWSEKWTDGEPLGGGGQGDTLLVKSKSDESKQAVLKLLKPHKAQDPKARRRMYQEVANLKILRSAGGKVPEVMDSNTESFDQLDVPMYFVMEFVAGHTLANLIEQNSALPVDISIGVAMELCSILRVAAKEGIVHRDIKPENIIVRSTTPPDVVMVDFGLSFNEETDQTNTSVDEGLDNKFLSLPERRIPGENKRDPRSDITDVCAILFYCLTGCSPRNLRDSQNRPPHRRANYELTGRVQNPSQLALLNGLLDRGLSNELDARFQTVEDLVGRLNEVANPSAKLPVEDLETILARETLALRKSDRVTQLADYFQNAQQLGPVVEQGYREIANTLSKQQTFSIQLVELVNRITEKVDGGDCFAKWVIRLQVRDHRMIFELRFSIVAYGSECEIGYATFQTTPKVRDLQVGERQVCLRYQGDTVPSEDHLIREIRAAVAKAIQLMSETVRMGY